MLVSVIMSVYKEPINWVKQSIDSIINQTYKNIEFIIICDDPTNEELIQFIKNYIIDDKRVKFHINERNEGLIVSLNYAISLAQGGYIARMDADDISMLDRLEKQKIYLESNNLDLIGSNVTLFSEQGDLGTTNKPLEHRYIAYLLKMGAPAIVHPTFFGKREVFSVTNGYNISAYHAEDMEFIAHVLSAGYKVGNMHDSLVKVRFSYGSITKNNAYIMYLTSIMVKKAYITHLKIGGYCFKGVDLNDINEQALLSFKYKQIALTKAKESLSHKKIFTFLFYVIKAFNHAPIAMLNTVKINIALKYIQLLQLFKGNK